MPIQTRWYSIEGESIRRPLFFEKYSQMSRSPAGPGRRGGVGRPAKAFAGLCRQAGAGPGLRLRLALRLRGGARGRPRHRGGFVRKDAGSGSAKGQLPPGGVSPRRYRGRGLPLGALRRGVQLPGHPLPAGLPRLGGEGPHLAQARRGLCVLGGAPHLHRLRQPGLVLRRAGQHPPLPRGQLLLRGAAPGRVPGGRTW